VWFTFEQALRRKCEQNPDLALLLSQWEYDRRLVADALQTVVRYFPHYSRHDASHSNTILVQVARVLGQERIDALSATDLWLLLEAAYQHDIGMVVTDAQVRAWWEDPKFKDFLAQLQQGPDLELRRTALLLDAQGAPRDLPRDWPIEVSRTLTLAVAEYARRQHAANADRIIRDPERTIGLLSPRTPLIPARLFRLLGTICSHHGRSFEDTLRLPLQESGLGTDDAHPRFVACMLRLGDLLDLDNGRFCPVMVRSFGTLPASSMAHFEKHAAINHLRVSQTRIEVEAECESYESYEVTEQWLEWLRNELKNQMAHWSDIVPSPLFGALPSLGNIQSHIRGYLTLEAGRRPQFEVDREQILALVRGANIYKDSFAFIRELVQNAVDATLLRVWLERWSSKSKEELKQLTPRDLRKELEGYPIRIGFSQVESPASSERVRWRFYVEDKGTGISLNDVRYIQRIGSSSKNPDRQRVIREMPEWMRPSGIFGIGLQSAFLFTDKVVIKTRHHATHEALELILQNGRGSGIDGLSIRRMDEKPARLSVGTRIEFDIDMERVPRLKGLLSRITFGREFSFDPIVDSAFPYEAQFIKKLLENFSGACLCPIELDTVRGQKIAAKDVFADAYFDPESNLEIKMRATLQDRDYLSAPFYYRGTPVVNASRLELSVYLLDVTCNIHAGRADELLQLNRENFTEEGERKLREGLRAAIKRLFPRYIESLRHEDADSHEFQVASLYAWLDDVAPGVVGEEWRRIRIGRQEHTWTLNEVLAQTRIDLIRMAILGHRQSGFEYVKIVQRGESHIEIQDFSDSFLLHATLMKAFGYHGYHGREFLGTKWELATNTETFVFAHKREDAEVTRNGLRSILHAASKPQSHWGGRYTIPCPAAYSMLQCDLEEQVDGYFEHVVHMVHPRMVCPFIVNAEGAITLPGLSKLVEWTALHATGGPRAEADVARALWEFIRASDELMAELWKDRKAYDLGSVKYELGRWLK
jgi:hypothetical protein